jgi:CP family cyanate transporter-like MFS transporter
MVAWTLRRHPEMVVILAGISAAMHVGKLSPAIPALRAALDVSLLQAGFLLSLVQLAGMLLGLAVGLAADSLGLKRSMLAGLTLLSVAGALGALAQGPGSLLALRACEGFGFLLAVMPGPGLIRRLTVPGKMQSAMGMWGAYMPFGTALALATGPMVIDAGGWRSWWLLLAGMSLLMVAWVAIVVAPDSPAGHGRGPVVHGQEFGGAWIARVQRTLSARGPWLVALCFALYSGQWLAVIGFLPSVVAQGGNLGAATGSLLALAALVNVIGNVASGRLLQKGVPAHRLLTIGFVAMAIGAVVAFADIGWSQSPGVVASIRYVGVLLFSMVGGLIPGTLFSLAVRLAPDESSVSTTVGWMQQLSALGQFIGPPAVALIAAGTGGWNWTWIATGACCLLGMVVAQRIRGQLQHGTA